MSDTVTRERLATAICEGDRVARHVAASILESILEELCLALIRGETVKLSAFGTFNVRQKGRRMGRNPKTGELHPIPPRKVVVFRASHVLKDGMNGRPPRTARQSRGDGTGTRT